MVLLPNRCCLAFFAYLGYGMSLSNPATPYVYLCVKGGGRAQAGFVRPPPLKKGERAAKLREAPQTLAIAVHRAGLKGRAGQDSRYV